MTCGFQFSFSSSSSLYTHYRAKSSLSFSCPRLRATLSQARLQSLRQYLSSVQWSEHTDWNAVLSNQRFFAEPPLLKRDLHMVSPQTSLHRIPTMQISNPTYAILLYVLTPRKPRTNVFSINNSTFNVFFSVLFSPISWCFYFHNFWTKGDISMGFYQF